MKKAKRYDEGGDVESYEDMNAGMAEAANATPTASPVEAPDMGTTTPIKSEAAAPAKQSFSQAFAAARKGGGKTFEYNGKKYTTDMAGSKPAAAAPKAAPKAIQEQGSRMRPTQPEAAPEAPKRVPGVIRGTSFAESVDMAKKAMKAREDSKPKVDSSKMTAKEAGKSAQTRGINAGAMSNFKMGGKINGIAQRGKTRGKMC